PIRVADSARARIGRDGHGHTGRIDLRLFWGTSLRHEIPRPEMTRHENHDDSPGNACARAARVPGTVLIGQDRDCECNDGKAAHYVLRIAEARASRPEN